MSGSFTLAENLALSLSEYSSIPVPADLAPDSPMNWDVLTDDQLMAIPPHMVVHMMRTAAQGGTQIVSPRQVPSTNIVKRTHQDSTSTFVHLAGSAASRGAAWPVPAGYAAPDLDDLDSEPLVKVGTALSRRRPTPADHLVVIGEQVASPIQRAWIKARAAVDLQARTGVSGDAEALSRAYERLFGAAEGSLMQDPGLVISSDSTFRSLALMTDNSMARQLAPIHARRVVSVSVGPSSASAFGPHRGFDWTCARVVAEAKFTLTVQNEGYSLVDVSVGSVAQVGYLLQHPMERSGAVIAYHPTPGVAWSCDPMTFSVHPDLSKSKPRFRVAEWVADELIRGAEFASPLASAAAYRATVDWTRTAELGHGGGLSDTLSGGVRWALEAALSTGVMGKDVSRQLRAEVYQAIAKADVPTGAKTIRAIDTVRGVMRVCKRWLKVTEGVVLGLAGRLISMDAHINAHMNNAAVTRGSDPETWFARLVQQLPVSLRDVSPGTRGWGTLAVYFMLNPPDDKWESLTAAARFKTKSTMETISSVESVDEAIPSKNHHEVMRVRAKSLSARVSDTYSASYDGAALGSVYCARMADAANLPKLAKLFRVNAAAWTFRMRYCRYIYTTIGPISDQVPENSLVWKSTSENLTNVSPTQVTTRVCPHTAYSWYVKRLKIILGGSNVRIPEELVAGKATDLIRRLNPVKPDLLELGRTTVAEKHWDVMDASRYAVSPSYFADKLEEGMLAAMEDSITVVRSMDHDLGVIGAADAVAGPSPMPRLLGGLGQIDEGYIEGLTEAAKRSVKNGYYWLSFVDPLDSEFVQEIMDSAEWADEVLNTEYPNLESFMADIDGRTEVSAGVGSHDALS
jgi:hypothetical protein